MPSKEARFCGTFGDHYQQMSRQVFARQLFYECTTSVELNQYIFAGSTNQSYKYTDISVHVQYKVKVPAIRHTIQSIDL